MCRTQLTGRQSTGVAKRALNENRDSQSMCKMWDVWVCVEFIRNDMVRNFQESM